MPKIHVLQAVRPNTYVIVVHDTTPVGNNSAGISWSTAIVNSGRAKTVMTEGVGPGQISTSEKVSVENGTVLEGQFHFQDDPSWTPGQRNSALDQVATQVLAELQARYAAELKWFGASRP